MGIIKRIGFDIFVTISLIVIIGQSIDCLKVSHLNEFWYYFTTIFIKLLP